MRYILLAFLGLLFVQPTVAQEIYLQPNAPVANDSSEAKEDIDELLGNKEPARAPQTIAEHAYAYHQNCLKTQHPVLAGEDLELLCSCTALKFSEVMSLEQIQAMQNNTKEGLFQRNRMLLFVYTPCIYFPTRAMIMNECMTKTQNKYLMRNQSATCQCLAHGVAEDMKEFAPKYIEQALLQKEDTLDPLGLLMNSEMFDTRSQYHARLCLKRHEGVR